MGRDLLSAFLPDWRWPGCADWGSSISVSSPCVHPAALRLNRRVEAINVSAWRGDVYCVQHQFNSGLRQPFLKLSVRTVAVNDISTGPRGYRGKAKASRKANPLDIQKAWTSAVKH